MTCSQKGCGCGCNWGCIVFVLIIAGFCIAPQVTLVLIAIWILLKILGM